MHLSNAERYTVLRGCRDALDKEGFGDVGIIAGTASQNIQEVVEQLGEAKRAGSGWGLVLVPGYFSGASTQEGIIAVSSSFCWLFGMRRFDYGGNHHMHPGEQITN